MKPLIDVRPAQPAAAYVGGKKNLSGRICRIIERTPHDSYAEGFVGMGGIFLRRRRRPAAEAINDVSGDVANFFRVLQEHYAYFVDMLRFRVASRNEFERLKALPAERLTDLQRAVRFLYLQKLAFGGKIAGRNFGVDASRERFNVTRLEPMLAEIHERLAGVVIEQLVYADFIRRYDRAGALFYLDPPYWGSETDYGQDVFGRDDFGRLADQLAGIKGRFLLSINDAPGVRDVFARFPMREVETIYSVSKVKGMDRPRVGELIISNYVID